MIIHDVEQGTEEWFQLRAGLPTASEAAKLVTSTGKASTQITDYARCLAADRYAKKIVDQWEGNAATMRGNIMEEEARDAYSFIFNKEVHQVGFVTNDDMTYGASPDGLIGDKGLLEIKCLQKKGHMEMLVYIDLKEQAPPKYIPQVQMQLFVTGREWCDLFYYHPDLPAANLRIYPDMQVISTLESQLEKLNQEIIENLQVIARAEQR